MKDQKDLFGTETPNYAVLNEQARSKKAKPEQKPKGELPQKGKSHPEATSDK